MPLYIAVEEPSGYQRRLNSELQSNVEPIGADESLVIISRFDVEPYPDEQTWNPVLRDYEPTIAPVVLGNVMSKGAFMARLGFAREVLVNVLRIDPNTPILVRAQIEALYAELGRRPRVDVTYPTTIMGVDLLAGILVSVNDLASADVSAFKAAMLAPPTALEV